MSGFRDYYLFYFFILQSALTIECTDAEVHTVVPFKIEARREQLLVHRAY